MAERRERSLRIELQPAARLALGAGEIPRRQQRPRQEEPADRILRVHRDGAAERRERAHRVARRLEQPAEIEERLEVGRMVGDLLAIGGRRVGGAAFRLEKQRAVVARMLRLRVDRQRPVERGVGSDGILAAERDDRQADLGARGLRFDLERLLEAPLGVGIAAGVELDLRQPVENLGVFRVGFEVPAVAGDRGVDVAAGHEGVGQADHRPVVLGPALERLAVVLRRTLPVALAEVDVAEGEPGVDDLRILRQHFAQQGDRLRRLLARDRPRARLILA